MKEAQKAEEEVEKEGKQEESKRRAKQLEMLKIRGYLYAKSKFSARALTGPFVLAFAKPNHGQPN